MPRSQNSTRTGFTLIELLVVIAIISLLVSILLPSLNRAKDLARSVNCRVNLKNYGTGMQFYIEENNGILPQKFYLDPPWYLRIAPYLGASDDGAGNILFADTHVELVPVLDVFGQGREPPNGMLWNLPVTKVDVD